MVAATQLNKQVHQRLTERERKSIKWGEERESEIKHGEEGEKEGGSLEERTTGRDGEQRGARDNRVTKLTLI